MTHGHIHHGPIVDGARCRSEKKIYTGSGIGQTLTFNIRPEFVMIFRRQDNTFYHYYDKDVDQSLKSGQSVSDPVYNNDIVKNNGYSMDVSGECDVVGIVYESLAFQVSPHLFYEGYAMNYWTPGFHKHLTGMEDKYKGRMWTDTYLGMAGAHKYVNMVHEPGYLIIIDHDDELVYHTINPYCGVSSAPLYTLVEGYNITIPDRILNAVFITVGSGIVMVGDDLNIAGHIYTYINFGGLSSYDCPAQKGGGGPGHLHKGGWDTYNRTLMATFKYTGDGAAILNINLRSLLNIKWLADFVIVFRIEFLNERMYYSFLTYGSWLHGSIGSKLHYSGPTDGDGVDYDIDGIQIYESPGKTYFKVWLAAGLNELDKDYYVWLLKLI